MLTTNETKREGINKDTNSSLGITNEAQRLFSQEVDLRRWSLSDCGQTNQNVSRDERVADLNIAQLAEKALNKKTNGSKISEDERHAVREICKNIKEPANKGTLIRFTLRASFTTIGIGVHTPIIVLGYCLALSDETANVIGNGGKKDLFSKVIKTPTHIFGALKREYQSIWRHSKILAKYD